MKINNHKYCENYINPLKIADDMTCNLKFGGNEGHFTKPTEPKKYIE